MRTVLAIISFVASALAYQVVTPNQSQGWTTAGSNNVTWDRVDTDATNFTLILTNQDRSILPTDEVLKAFVDGTTGNQTVSAPSGGFPVGQGFRVNIVQDTTHTSTIYAQSSEFAITQSNSSVSSASSTASSSSSGTFSGSSSAISTASSAVSSNTVANLNPTSSQTGTSPSSSNAATRSSFGSQGVLAAVLVIGYFFA